MNRPKVSILTPVKIRAKEELEWLDECISSVQAQTERDWEMVIVDDNSPEELDPYETVRRYGNEDNRIQLYHMLKTLTGTSNARNAAARLATSELILPLDADDKLGPGTVEAYLTAWKGEGFLYPSVTLFGNDEGELTVPPEPYDFDKLLRSTFLLVGNIHRKADWERVGGWRSDMGAAYEDWEYWIHLGKIGVCGIPTPTARYYYRRNPFGRIYAIKKNPIINNTMVARIKTIHVDLYKGVRPNMCCGPRKPSGSRKSTPNSLLVERDLTNVPGAAAGLVRLRYKLGNAGLVPWTGPVTGHTYVFSSTRPVSYVDREDAQQMINLRQNKQIIFEILPEMMTAKVEEVKAQAVPVEPAEQTNPTVLPLQTLSVSEVAPPVKDFESEYQMKPVPFTKEEAEQEEEVKPARKTAKRKKGPSK